MPFITSNGLTEAGTGTTITAGGMPGGMNVHYHDVGAGEPVLPDTPTAARNRYVIAAANNVGFTVNLSANNPRGSGQAGRSGDRARRHGLLA